MLFGSRQAGCRTAVATEPLPDGSGGGARSRFHFGCSGPPGALDSFPAVSGAGDRCVTTCVVVFLFAGGNTGGTFAFVGVEGVPFALAIISFKLLSAQLSCLEVSSTFSFVPPFGTLTFRRFFMTLRIALSLTPTPAAPPARCPIIPFTPWDAVTADIFPELSLPSSSYSFPE